MSCKRGGGGGGGGGGVRMRSNMMTKAPTERIQCGVKEMRKGAWGETKKLNSHGQERGNRCS